MQILHHLNDVLSYLPAVNVDPDKPLDPSKEVKLDKDVKSGIEGLLALLKLGAWLIVSVSLTACAVIMAWSWRQGKPIQALANIGWVAGAALVLGAGMGLVETVK
jgi:hypothetical protein